MDVWESDWFFYFVCVGVKAGLINGYPDGTFKPASPINFAEASKIIVKALFTDSDFEASHTETWYAEYVFQLTSNNAVPLSIRSPDQLITRGEMAEMIYRLKAGVFDKPSTTFEELLSVNAQTTITLFFYSEQDVKNLTYEATFPVERKIAKTSKVADATMRALFAGPTDTEYKKGARTMDVLSDLGKDYISVNVHATYPNPNYAPGYGMETTLKNVAVINFRSDAFRILNGAAGAQFQAKAAIEATLLHFPTIDEVLYMKDGVIFIYWDA